MHNPTVAPTTIPTLRASMPRAAARGVPAAATICAMLGAALFAVPAPAVAQGSSDQQFQTDGIYAGPRAWVGNLNGAVAIGGQVERGFTEPGEYGPGIIAGGLGLDYYSWSTSIGVGSYRYSVLPIQLFGNYHFVLDANPRIDPYVGMAFVYQVVSAEWTGAGESFGSTSASGSLFAGQVGARYFLSDKLALQGQVGFGYGTIGLGAAWRF